MTIDKRADSKWGKGLQAIDKPVCCLTCSTKFRFGQFIIDGPDLRCPKCKSTDCQPIGYAASTDEFHGERGPLQ